MANITSPLTDWDLNNKRVLVRADLNVPIAHGTIINDYRLQALLPTIDYIQSHGGKVIIMTHIGRPKQPTPTLSTQLLVPWFTERNYEITWAADAQQAMPESFVDAKKILLLENLRFFSAEKSDDASFAKRLAALGDYYINDAFGTLHRHDTSITLVPKFFAPDKRGIGLLVQKELAMLNRLVLAPEQPFVLILGGGKASDKIPLLNHLIDKAQTILLCPAIVFTFLKAQGIAVGKSLIDNQALPLCQALIAKAKKYDTNICFPLDYQVALDTLQGELIIVDANSIPENAIGMSIGPKTVELFTQKINEAKTLFFNAAMGFETRKETLRGTRSLLRAISKAQSFRVVGGGDSVAAAQMIHVDTQIDYLSTGGGATLAYLSGQKLPGLLALEDN